MLGKKSKTNDLNFTLTTQKKEIKLNLSQHQEGKNKDQKSVKQKTNHRANE